MTFREVHVSLEPEELCLRMTTDQVAPSRSSWVASDFHYTAKRKDATARGYPNITL